MRSVQLRARHLIDAVERAYCLDGSDERWLESVLAAAHSDFDLGCGTYALNCRVVDERLEPGKLFSQRGLPPNFLPLLAEINADVPPEVTRVLARIQSVCGSHGEFFGSGHPSVARFDRIAGPHGYRDALSLFVQDVEGHAVTIAAPAVASIEVHPRVGTLWRRAGMHILAAWRLRRRLGVQALARDALLDDRGKVQDVTADLESDGAARRALLEGVARVDRARSKERSSPERALELWQGLVAGRWSLVDHWEGSGRRFIAVYKNLPEVPDPRALSMQERAIARALWLGASNKEIAFGLGIPIASVETAVRRILKKLRCRRREDLVALGDPATWHVASLPLGIDVAISAPSKPLTELTPAERAIVDRVIAGDTNAAIGRKRRTSVHTVANQLQSIFRRLGVRSRAELVRRVRAG